MRRISLLIMISFLLQGSPFAQTLTNRFDSTWFADYFTRVNFQRELLQPAAYDSLEIVRGLAEKQNYTPALCDYYIDKASWLLNQGKVEDAIKCLEKAISLAESEKLDVQAGDAYLSLANLYEFNGNTLAAAENYLQATKLLKHLGKKRMLIGLSRNLYSILNRLEQKNNALENMLSAVMTSRNNETDLVQIINTRNNEGMGFSFPDLSLIKEVNAHAIYIVMADAKFVVTNYKTLASYGASREIQRIPAGTVSQIPDFPRNGSILMELEGDPKVYIVKDSLLYHISNTDVLENFGGWDAVYFTPSRSLGKFPKSTMQVTGENWNTIFNLHQEFDNLSDSIRTALNKNELLSTRLSREVAERNTILQKRKILLYVSALGLIALLLIVILLARNHRQKQKLNEHSFNVLKKDQAAQRKMEIEKERTRIATDMHDDLGAGLSRIKFLSETIGIKKQKQQPIGEDINSIRQYSHEMIDKMGEIVWALNEKNDSLVDLLSYTRAYTVEYLTQHGIGCDVKMPDSFPTLFVSGEIRRNIYLCVKEALHNVVKHAQASQVSFTIRIDNNLVLYISDNGTGFDPANIRANRNGLANMKKRMTDIGGSLAINNNSGTELKLSVPLHL